MKREISIFSETDRERVRRIAAATAKGYPRSDLQLVADLITNYYINYEPEHLLVARDGNLAVGYLSGCFDTSRCRWIKGTRVIPQAVIRSVFRGKVGWREVRYLGSLIYVTLHGGLRNSPPSGYPAHFHINVAEGWRGQGIGTELAEEFLTLLSDARISGVHVRVRHNERRTSRFFKSLGFSRENSYPILVCEGNEFRTSRSIIYTKKI